MKRSWFYGKGGLCLSLTGLGWQDYHRLHMSAAYVSNWGDGSIMSLRRASGLLMRDDHLVYDRGMLG